MKPKSKLEYKNYIVYKIPKKLWDATLEHIIQEQENIANGQPE